MTENCEDYFLVQTAIRIWAEDDREAQAKMLACLNSRHKESFFRQVCLWYSKIPHYLLREMANDVFFATWEEFNHKGREGRLPPFKEKVYTGYFFKMFRGNYRKALEKEIRRMEAEKNSIVGQPTGEDLVVEIGKEELLTARTRKALAKIGLPCRQLLIWKHIIGLSHDEIAGRRGITWDSSVKMVSRCGRRFYAFLRDNY